jgi:hypothetical protein
MGNAEWEWMLDAGGQMLEGRGQIGESELAPRTSSVAVVAKRVFGDEILSRWGNGI